MSTSLPIRELCCATSGLARWTHAGLAITLVSLGTLSVNAVSRGQETPPDAVDTVTEAENVPREAEQAPQDAEPLPVPAQAEPAQSDQPTAEQGTTGAARTAPPSRIDFRRFGAKFAEVARDATPADQAAAGALTIAKVRSPSAASLLGLKPQDQIISVAGQPITSSAQIGQAIEKALSTGRRDDHVAIPLVIRRDGAEQTLTISNDELTYAGYGPLLTEYGHYVPPQYLTRYRGASDSPDVPANPSGAYLGVELDRQYRNAAIVSRVLPGTPAAQAGLQAGDRIFAINNRPVDSPNELIYWVSQMQPGDTIEISYDRAHDVDVTLGTRSGNASGTQQPEAATPEPAESEPEPSQAPAPAPSE